MISTFSREPKQWFQRQWFSWLQGLRMIKIFVWCLFAWALNRVENWNQIQLHATAAVCALLALVLGNHNSSGWHRTQNSCKKWPRKNSGCLLNSRQKWIAMSQIIMLIVKRENNRYKTVGQVLHLFDWFCGPDLTVSTLFNSWSTWSACWRNSDNETTLCDESNQKLFFSFN